MFTLPQDKKVFALDLDHTLFGNHVYFQARYTTLSVDSIKALIDGITREPDKNRNDEWRDWIRSQLKKGHCVSIVSRNSFGALAADYFLEKIGLSAEERQRIIIISQLRDEDHHHKNGLLHALVNIVACKPEQVVLIDDTSRNVTEAKSKGYTGFVQPLDENNLSQGVPAACLERYPIGEDTETPATTAQLYDTGIPAVFGGYSADGTQQLSKGVMNIDLRGPRYQPHAMRALSLPLPDSATNIEKDAIDFWRRLYDQTCHTIKPEGQGERIVAAFSYVANDGCPRIVNVGINQDRKFFLYSESWGRYLAKNAPYNKGAYRNNFYLQFDSLDALLQTDLQKLEQQENTVKVLKALSTLAKYKTEKTPLDCFYTLSEESQDHLLKHADSLSDMMKYSDSPENSNKEALLAYALSLTDEVQKNNILAILPNIANSLTALNVKLRTHPALCPHVLAIHDAHCASVTTTDQQILLALLRSGFTLENLPNFTCFLKKLSSKDTYLTPINQQRFINLVNAFDKIPAQEPHKQLAENLLILVANSHNSKRALENFELCLQFISAIQTNQPLSNQDLSQNQITALSQLLNLICRFHFKTEFETAYADSFQNASLTKLLRRGGTWATSDQGSSCFFRPKKAANSASVLEHAMPFLKTRKAGTTGQRTAEALTALVQEKLSLPRSPAQTSRSG